MQILSMLLFIIGIISINLIWIIFLFILGAIIFKYDYPIFSLTHLSLIGTPFELFIFGLTSLFLSGYIAIKLNKNNKIY